MKSSGRLKQFRISPDALSSFLAPLRYDIVYFTNWPNQDNKHLRNIVSTHIKLVLQESGTSELTTGDRRFCFGAGSAVLIPPYTVYDARTYDGVNSFEIFFNVAPVTQEQEFLQRTGLRGVTHFAEIMKEEDFTYLRSIYTGIREGQAGAYAQLHAFITTLLVRFAGGFAPTAPTPALSPREQAVVEHLFDYMDTHLSEPVRVEDVCSALQVSQSYLYRCCRDVMNCSTRELITRRKMAYARTLLKNPDMTITEVAEAAGYDPYHFSNLFKKIFLMSPSDYRRRV